MSTSSYFRSLELAQNNDKLNAFINGQIGSNDLNSLQLLKGDLDKRSSLTLNFCPPNFTVAKAMAFYAIMRNKMLGENNYRSETVSVFAEWCPNPKMNGSKNTILQSTVNGQQRSMNVIVNRDALLAFSKACKKDEIFLGTSNGSAGNGKSRAKLHVIKIVVPVPKKEVTISNNDQIKLVGAIISHKMMMETPVPEDGSKIKLNPKVYSMLVRALMDVFSVNVDHARQISEHFSKISTSDHTSVREHTGEFKPKLVCDIQSRKILKIKDSNKQYVPLKVTLSPHAMNELQLWFFKQGYTPNKMYRSHLASKAHRRDIFGSHLPALLAYLTKKDLAYVNGMNVEDKRMMLKNGLSISDNPTDKLDRAVLKGFEKIQINANLHSAKHVIALHKRASEKLVVNQPKAKGGAGKGAGKSNTKTKTIVALSNPGLRESYNAHNQGFASAIQTADYVMKSITAKPSGTDVEMGLERLMDEVDYASQQLSKFKSSVQKDEGIKKMSNRSKLRFYNGIASILRHIITYFIAMFINLKGTQAAHVSVSLRNGTGLGFINTGSNSHYAIADPVADTKSDNLGFINTGSNVHGDKASKRSLYSVYSADDYSSALSARALSADGSVLGDVWRPSDASSTLTADQVEYWSVMQLPSVVLAEYSWPTYESDGVDVPYGRDHLTDMDGDSEICYRAFAPVSEADDSCCKPGTDVFMDVPGGSVITSCLCSDIQLRIDGGEDVPYADRCLPDGHVGPTLCCMSLVDTLSYRNNDEYHEATVQLQHQINGHTTMIMDQINAHVVNTDGDITALEESFSDLDSGMLNLSTSIVLYVDVVAATKVSVDSFNSSMAEFSRQLGLASSNHSDTTGSISELSASLDDFTAQQSETDNTQDSTLLNHQELIASQDIIIGEMNETINILTEQLDQVISWLGGDVSSGGLNNAIELEILSPHLDDAINRRLNEVADEVLPDLMAQFVTPASYVVSWECGGTNQPACTDSADSTYTWESTCDDATWTSVSVQVDPNDDGTCPDGTSSGIDIGCTPYTSDANCDSCYVFGNSTCAPDDTIPDNVWETTMLANGLDSVTNNDCKCYAFCSNTTSDDECDLSRTRYDYGYRGTKVSTNVTTGSRRVQVEFSQDNGKYVIGDNHSLGMWITSDFVTRCKTHDNTTCYYNKECAISYTELTGNLPLTCWSNEHPNIFSTEVDTPRASVLRSMAQFDTVAPISSYKTSAQVALIAVVVVLSIIVIAGGIIMYIYLCKKKSAGHSKAELKAMTHEQLLDHCKKLGVTCDSTLADSVLISMIQQCEATTERYSNGKDKNMNCMRGAMVIASRARTLARKACRKCTSKLKEMSDEDAKLMGTADQCSIEDAVEYRELLNSRGAPFVAECIMNAGGVGSTALPMPVKQFLIEKLALSTGNPVRDVSPWFSSDTPEGKNYRSRVSGSKKNSQYINLYMIPTNTKVKSLKNKGVRLNAPVEVTVGNSIIKCDRVTYLAHSSDSNGMTLQRRYETAKLASKSAPAKLRVPKRALRKGSMMAGSNKIGFLWSVFAAIVSQIPYSDACDGSFSINSLVDVISGNNQVGVSATSTLLTIPSTGQCKYEANTTINLDGVKQNVGVNLIVETRSVGVTTSFDEEFVTANYEFNTGTIFSCGFALSSNNDARGDFCEVSGGGAQCTSGTGLIDYTDVSKLIKANGLSNNVDEYGALTEGTYVCKGVNAFSTQSPAWCVFGGCSELIGVASPPSSDLDGSRASVNSATGPDSTTVYTSYVLEVVESGEVLLNVTCPITSGTTTCVDSVTNNTIVITPQSFPDYSSSITDNSDYRWFVREDYKDGDTDKVRYGPWASTTTCNEVPDIKAGSWAGVWDGSQNELGSCMDVTKFNYDSGSGKYTVPEITPMWSRIWGSSEYQKSPVELGDWNCYASNLERTCTTTDYDQSFMATLELPQMDIDWTAVQESGDFTISNCTIDGYSLSSANSSRIDCNCDGEGSARITAVDGDKSFTEVKNIKLLRNTAECSDDKVKILFTAAEGNVDFWIQLQDQGRTSRSTRNTWTHVNGYLSNDMIDTNTSISNWTTTGISVDGQHSNSNDFLEILIACICGVVIIAVIVVIVYCYCRPEAKMQRQMQSMQSNIMLTQATSRAFDGTMYRGGSQGDPSKMQ